MRHTALYILTLLVLAGGTSAQQLQTQIFQLNAAPVESVLGTVQGVLSPQGTAAPEPRLNKLIVRDTPKVLAEVDRLLQELDRYAPQVRIYVNMSGASSATLSNAGVGADGSGVRAGAGVDITRSTVETQQNLIVMSGGKGVIHISRDVLTVNPYQEFAIRLGLLPAHLFFQSVGTGFEVEPIVQGGVVNMKITPWLSFIGPDGARQIVVSEASTRVAVPSGQTVSISSGGYSQDTKNEAFGLILGVGSGSYSTHSSVELRPVIVE